MGNPVFQTSGAWATVSTMGGTYFLQGGEYFDSKFTYIGPVLPDFPTPMTMENTGSVNAISIVKNGSDVAVSMTGSAAVQLYAGWIEFDGEYWDA